VDPPVEEAGVVSPTATLLDVVEASTGDSAGGVNWLVDSCRFFLPKVTPQLFARIASVLLALDGVDERGGGCCKEEFCEEDARGEGREAWWEDVCRRSFWSLFLFWLWVLLGIALDIASDNANSSGEGLVGETKGFASYEDGEAGMG